jgi:hypothetical protein
MKILRINLTHLRNEEHFMLMSEVVQLVNSAEVAVREVAIATIADLTSLLEREDKALEQILKSQLTDRITAADLVRDNLLHAITLKVEAYAFSHAEAEVQAAAALQAVVDHYGDFRRKPYNEESATVHNYVQSLRALPQAVEALGLEGWLAALAEANDEVKQLMAQRHDGQAAVQVERLREVRTAIDAVYQRMAAMVDASIVLKGEAPYATFVNRLNERIAYYKTTLAARKSRSKAKEEAEEEKNTKKPA